jgi:hypothetical protein
MDAIEIMRLRLAEFGAEQRYETAMKRSDVPAMRAAAEERKRAAGGLAKYVEKHQYPKW